MTLYQLEFTDDTETQFIDADYWQKEYNERSRTFEYVFYKNGNRVKVVPILWLMGDPQEA